VHKINPDIHLICELHVTVKLYKAVRSLSDSEKHIFRIREIRIRAVCLLPVPVHKNMSVRKLGYQRKYEVGNVRDNDHNLI